MPSSVPFDAHTSSACERSRSPFPSQVAVSTSLRALAPMVYQQQAPYLDPLTARFRSAWRAFLAEGETTEGERGGKP